MRDATSGRLWNRRRFLHAGGFAGAAAALPGLRQGKARSVAAAVPRVPLVHLPTPLEELTRLSEKLGGPRLLVKRDDLTGLAFGGNKSRKLEYLVAAARAEGADTLVTPGSLQSNHCRQTAAAAARCGLACVLVLQGEKPDAVEGNLLLDHLLGAEVEIGEASLDEIAERLRARGRKPYVIPSGGSNGVGATAYAVAIEELASQLRERGETVDWIVTATGSGGTQGGMAVGAAASGFKGRILGIAVSRAAEVAKQRVARAANETAAHLGLRRGFEPGDFDVNAEFLGDGYAAMGEREVRAIRTAAATEGLLLDPVYTGRAFGGVLELIERGFFRRGQTVLFWHTGGTPALFLPKYGGRLLV